MKILHINADDIVGGAAQVAWRMHSSLLDRGIDSKLLVAHKNSDDANVQQLTKKNRVEILTGIGARIAGIEHRRHTAHLKLLENPWFLEADILHLHNLHGGYFNHESLIELSKHKPLIMTLHDQWFITGHCAYSLDCTRWQKACGSCPHLDVYPAMKNDHTRQELKRKKHIIQDSNIRFTCYSKWMMGLLPLSIASQSRAVYFPMGIDTRDYFPIDTQIARNALGIPEGKIVLLVAAQYLNDARKGIELVINSLNRLGENSRHRVVLLTMGGGHLPIKPASEIQTVSLGFVEQLPIKRLAYSAADFFINCPKSELFGLVVQESMSCGTPVIGTRVGGIPEMIDSETGHLIEPGDQGALDIVTQNIVNGKITKQSFSQKCVTSIRQKFSFEQMGESLERTYTDMLNE